LLGFKVFMVTNVLPCYSLLPEKARRILEIEVLYMVVITFYMLLRLELLLNNCR
jgi:hypothetical protein